MSRSFVDRLCRSTWGRIPNLKTQPVIAPGWRVVYYLRTFVNSVNNSNIIVFIIFIISPSYLYLYYHIYMISCDIIYMISCDIISRITFINILDFNQVEHTFTPITYEMISYHLPLTLELKLTSDLSSLT